MFSGEEKLDMGKNTMRFLCASLFLTMICWLAEGTLSKTDAKKGATKKLEEKVREITEILVLSNMCSELIELWLMASASVKTVLMHFL